MTRATADSQVEQVKGEHAAAAAPAAAGIRGRRSARDGPSPTSSGLSPVIAGTQQSPTSSGRGSSQPPFLLPAAASDLIRPTLPSPESAAFQAKMLMAEELSAIRSMGLPI